MTMLKKFIIFLICLFMAGCVNRSVYSDECRQMLFHYSLSKELQSDGVQVIHVGDEISLFLPSDKFFYAGSNNLRDVSKTLNRIIAYMNAYTIEDVEVKGFTLNNGDYTRNLALSRAQAEAISTYLWKHGLDARLVSANGLGCHHAYDMNGIEIFFRLPPPDNVFH
jgi:outer membrane protein OmpA-like peptidoglycan-associated protein